jgi:glycosyltransferase involved in cell wall biosynthesis
MQKKVGIVVPCYNEASRLDLDAFKAYINNNGNVDFLFVNDGSTDKTIDLLSTLTAFNSVKFQILNLEVNKGKAEAVRNGVIAMIKKEVYDYVGFWDADLATPLEEIDAFMKHLETYPHKIIIGTRFKRLGANIHRKPSRHFLGRIFSTFASIILNLPVYDTQCGAKMFHRSTMVIFENSFFTTWLFDIELLARYRNCFGRQNVLKDVYEYPVSSWIEKGDSKLKLIHILKVPFELLKIHRKYNEN